MAILDLLDLPAALLVDIDDQKGASGIDFDRPGNFERGLGGGLDHD